jgi:hypothetical protein
MTAPTTKPTTIGSFKSSIFSYETLYSKKKNEE